jgi:putative DNA primase/helicase
MAARVAISGKDICMKTTDCKSRLSAVVSCIGRVQAFKNAMLDAGMTPPDNLVGDGKLHRFNIDGKLNGAYVLHLDGRAAGYYQDFKQGIKEWWRLDGDFKPLTLAERQAFVIERQSQALEREQEAIKGHQQAATKARKIWGRAIFADTGTPCLSRKRV